MKGVIFAAVTMCASCVVMKPITPPLDLKPVAIGDASGSAETLIDPDVSPYVDPKGNGEAVLLLEGPQLRCASLQAAEPTPSRRSPSASTPPWQHSASFPSTATAGTFLTP